MTASTAGARLAWQRLARRSSIVAAITSLLAVAIVALLERRVAIDLAADRSLAGIALGVVLPLSCYGLVARAAGNARLEDAVLMLARHGASRRATVLGMIGAMLPVGALAGLVLASIAVLATRLPADPALGRDLLTSAWIGALAGACYTAWFFAASTFGKTGGGRLWALILDWVLGAGATAIALPWPRGHVRNLLGATPVMQLPQWASSVALLVLALASVTWALRRCPP